MHNPPCLCTHGSHVRFFLSRAVMDAVALENELYSTVSDKQVPEFDGSKKSRLGTIPSWYFEMIGLVTTSRYYMILHDITAPGSKNTCMFCISYHIISYYIILYYILFFFYFILYYMILYYIILYYITCCSVLLCYFMLCPIIL